MSMTGFEAPEAETGTRTIMVVDDHAVVRSGCRRLLEPPLGRYRVLEAADGRTALELAAREEPDAVLLDLNMPGDPNGLTLVQQLAATGTAIVVLSMHEAPQVASRCLEAGAMGYVSKSDDPDAVVRAVEAALEGRVWLSHAIANAVASLGRSLPLTPRERQIMALLTETTDLDQVAARLGVTYKTVANTLVRLRNRYNVRRTADLVRIAVQQGGAPPPV